MGSSFFFPLGNLLLCDRKYEKSQSEPRVNSTQAISSLGAFGKTSSLTAPNISDIFCLFVRVQVMSVPVVVTVHGNQQCDAEATIFWENAFSEKVCHIPEHIQLTSEKATGWLQLPDSNGKLFLISTHRSLPRFLRVQLFSYDVKNYAAREGCYPPQLKAEVDNILRDLHNSSHHTKADCPCGLVSNPIYHRSTSFPNKYTINGKLLSSSKFGQRRCFIIKN